MCREKERQRETRRKEKEEEGEERKRVCFDVGDEFIPSAISLNFVVACSLFWMLRSGCHFSACFLYAFLISSSDAPFSIPRIE